MREMNPLFVATESPRHPLPKATGSHQTLIPPLNGRNGFIPHQGTSDNPLIKTIQDRAHIIDQTTAFRRTAGFRPGSCPLWVKSRQSVLLGLCPLYPKDGVIGLPACG